jgi:large subunit ribosomal protein L22
MSKKSAPRRVSDNEARAYSRSMRVSPRKLNLMAQLIRGKSAEKALAALAFEKRRIAVEVRTVLESAIANAENNHQLDVDQLVVAEAYVGKSLLMRRFHARARGRAGKISKPFSNLTIIVREKKEAA